MRVFVTGTGRCGTSTFYQAARHCSNFSAAHESHAGNVQDDVYPDNHIEVSAHLVFAIPMLRDSYPDAKWIILQREKRACTTSLVMECSPAMIGYGRQRFGIRDEGQILEMVSGFYDDVHRFCKLLLPEARFVRLEQARAEWRNIWNWLGLQGNFEASLAEWDRAYNPAANRGRDNWKAIADA